MNREISELFQQYVMLYMRSNYNSMDENFYFMRIINGYGPALNTDSRMFSNHVLRGFLCEVYNRKNQIHMNELLKILPKRICDDVSPNIKAFWGAVECMSIDKERIAYPVYVRDMYNKINGGMNPYDEFISYAIEKYYEKFTNIGVYFSDVFVYIDMIINALNVSFEWKYDIKVDVSVDEMKNPIAFITCDDENVCCIRLEKASFIVNSGHTIDNRYSLCVDVTSEPFICIDKEDKDTFILNDYGFIGKQVVYMMCIISAIIEQKKFAKHKKWKSGIVNNVLAYIAEKSKDISHKVKTVVDVDGVFVLLYEDDGNMNTSVVKVAFVEFNQYADEIDKLFNDFTL